MIPFARFPRSEGSSGSTSVAKNVDLPFVVTIVLATAPGCQGQSPMPSNHRPLSDSSQLAAPITRPEQLHRPSSCR